MWKPNRKPLTKINKFDNFKNCVSHDSELDCTEQDFRCYHLPAIGATVQSSEKRFKAEKFKSIDRQRDKYYSFIRKVTHYCKIDFFVNFSIFSQYDDDCSWICFILNMFFFKINYTR